MHRATACTRSFVVSINAIYYTFKHEHSSYLSNIKSKADEHSRTKVVSPALLKEYIDKTGQAAMGGTPTTYWALAT